MAKITLHFIVNGEQVQLTIEPCKTLSQLLREDLLLFSIKEGCAQGDCGSCIVVMDNQAVNACLVLAAQVEGAEIMTLEGLAQNGRLHPLQRQFAEKWAFQCGFCTAGMLMSAYALYQNNPNPTREETQTAIEGNLCRCTSYRAIIEAIQASVEKNEAFESR